MLLTSSLLHDLRSQSAYNVLAGEARYSSGIRSDDRRGETAWRTGVFRRWLPFGRKREEGMIVARMLGEVEEES